MRNVWNKGGFGGRLVLALVACALLVRIAIPAGWMPQAHAGTVRIALCNALPGAPAVHSARALLEAAIPAPDGDPAPDAGADSPCAFAGMALAVSLPQAPPASAPSRSADRAVPFPDRTGPAPGRGLAAPPPPATGPPAFA
ncbi:hypothetical protein [Sphingosinithalassobacter sp. LHW66-3]|uniref:hypothetical protein n=1 Tax=Sphingosinithalassobacter sp. LHW66-3 TaxID=3424718 RepID=UPI003D6BD032